MEKKGPSTLRDMAKGFLLADKKKQKQSRGSYLMQRHLSRSEMDKFRARFLLLELLPVLHCSVSSHGYGYGVYHN